MPEFRPVREYAVADIRQAMAGGVLEMKLGPFSSLIASRAEPLLDFLWDTYRDAPVRLVPDDVTDVSINVRPPNLLRTYIRRQVIPDPGFQVPAIPLPYRLAPLSFEMGVNLAVALKCCRFMTLHAGVVASDQGAMFFCATSGGGKSTLVSALMEEGYRLFSDEFGVLNMETAELHPYPRPVSLKDASIEIVRDLAGAEWISPVLSDTPKGRIAYRRARPADIAQAAKPAKVKVIFFPKYQDGAKPVARRLPKSETVMRLIPSSTNYHLLGEPAFNALVDMVADAETYEITYGNTADSVRMVKDLAAKVGL